MPHVLLLLEVSRKLRPRIESCEQAPLCWERGCSDMPRAASVRWFICVALCEVLGLRVQPHTRRSQRSCASVSRVGDLSMQVDRSKLRKVPCPALQRPAPSHAQPPVAGLST